MTNIQKKSLQTISDELKSFDDIPIIRSIANALRETDIDKERSGYILRQYQEAMLIQKDKIHKAKNQMNELHKNVFDISSESDTNDVTESIRSDINELSIEDIESIRDYCDSLLKSFHDDMSEYHDDIQK